MARDETPIKAGSLCPAIKSAEIIGDKWILLILRELFFGTTRFNDFQRALPRISPTILSKRLKQLEEEGLIIRKTGPGGKTSDYHLTRCGRELGPLIDHMATWGLKWARRRLEDEDLDVASLMWDFHRTFSLEELPDGETVMMVKITDVDQYSNWWLLINNPNVDLCTKDPGKDVDLYLTTDLKTLAAIWMGDITLKSARSNGGITLTGSTHLVKTAARWLPRSSYADVKPERIR